MNKVGSTSLFRPINNNIDSYTLSLTNLSCAKQRVRNCDKINDGEHTVYFKIVGRLNSVK